MTILSGSGEESARSGAGAGGGHSRIYKAVHEIHGYARHRNDLPRASGYPILLQGFGSRWNTVS